MNRRAPLALILAWCVGPAAVWSAEPADWPKRWRVCVTDLHAPPYLNNQAEHPGSVERTLLETARQLGFRVEDSAHSMAQLLAKLRAGRIDLALVTAPELNLAPDAQSLQGLAVLNKPLLQMDIYLVQRQDVSAERLALMEAWWSAIAQRRDMDGARLQP